jgi:predicted transcriptional regulator
MELHLEPDLSAKLAQLAARSGSSAEVLVTEAIQRLVDYDAWFVREVERGLAQIERGEVLTHEAVGAQLEQFIAARRHLSQ